MENKKKNRLNELIGKQDMTNNDVQEVKDLFVEADVENSCKTLAYSFLQGVKASLDKLKPLINQSELDFFESLLNFVAERKF